MQAPNRQPTRTQPRRSTARPQPAPVRFAYVAGLDGLRAIAVIAVLLYHADVPWIPGGFLGVSVFFVISGYLITALLLTEWRQSGRIALHRFWLRRARRLLPALYALLIGVLVIGVLLLPDEVSRLRADAVAAATYVTNWYLIASHTSYFEAVGRPSLLRHLWSLAVEEQFYLVWPIILTIALRRWPLKRVVQATMIAAGSSTLLMAILYDPSVDPSRVYYGTDTRASELLLGAALACVWLPGQRPNRTSRGAALLLDLIGVGAVALLFVLFRHYGEYDRALYRGGFLAVTLTTLICIAVVVHPRVRLVTALIGSWPLRWIGVRSYSLYLWHWPVFMLTRPQLDLPLNATAVLILRLVLTAALAELSYRYVETPFRTGALSRAWNDLCRARGRRARQLALRWVGAIATSIMCLLLLGRSVSHAQPPARPAYLPVDSISAASAAPIAIAAPIPTAAPEATAAPLPTTEPITATPIFAIGDSVLLGSAAQVQQALPNVQIEASIGLQVAPAIDLVRARQQRGQHDPIVVVHLGNNGPFTTEEFDQLMSLLGDARRVVIMNDKVPRAWEAPNNDVLAQGVQRYPNAVLVDWHGAMASHPELFWDDGIHPRPEGAQMYADLLVAALTAH